MQTHFKLIELQLFPLKFNLSEEQYSLIIAVRAFDGEKERESEQYETNVEFN